MSVSSQPPTRQTDNNAIPENMMADLLMMIRGKTDNLMEPDTFITENPGKTVDQEKFHRGKQQRYHVKPQ